MPRSRRPDFTNTYHHIVIKGINSLPIFNTTKKCKKILEQMREVRLDHDLSIYAIGILDTHMHMFVRRNNHKLSRFYQRLKGPFTQWYNARNQRKGTIYDGRYFSSLVDSEAYFQSVWKYVQYQGVAAGLYGQPAEDPWSTAQVYAKGDERFNWIDWEEALNELNLEEKPRRVDWDEKPVKDWLENGLPIERHRKQDFIAEKPFIEKYMQIRKEQTRQNKRTESPLSWETMIEIAESHFQIDRQTFQKNTKKRDINRTRCLIVWAGRKFCHQSLGEMAKRMNVNEPTTSKMIKRSRSKHSDALRKWKNRLEKENRNV